MWEFRHWRQQGYSIVHFCISSDFSSSYQNACIAAADIGQVYVVDSRNLSTGQGLLVLHGAELAAAGQTAEEIQKACTDLAPQVEASFVIDRLDYLYKGGRCSALSAFGGNLLKLKPCIRSRRTAKMTPGKKYRGPIDKVMLQYADDRLRSGRHQQAPGVHHPPPRCARRWRPCGRRSWSCVPILRRSSKPPVSTVTSHCGPGTLGVLFIRTKISLQFPEHCSGNFLNFLKNRFAVSPLVFHEYRGEKRLSARSPVRGPTSHHAVSIEKYRRIFRRYFLLVCVSEGPGAVPEQGDGFPIFAYAVDG